MLFEVKTLSMPRHTYKIKSPAAFARAAYWNFPPWPLCSVLYLLLIYHWTAWPLKMGSIGSPETSVTYYQPRVRKIPEDGRSHFYRGWSLISRWQKPVTGQNWRFSEARLYDRPAYKQTYTLNRIVTLSEFSWDIHNTRHNVLIEMPDLSDTTPWRQEHPRSYRIRLVPPPEPQWQPNISYLIYIYIIQSNTIQFPCGVLNGLLVSVLMGHFQALY